MSVAVTHRPVVCLYTLTHVRGDLDNGKSGLSEVLPVTLDYANPMVRIFGAKCCRRRRLTSAAYNAASPA